MSCLGTTHGQPEPGPVSDTWIGGRGDGGVPLEKTPPPSLDPNKPISRSFRVGGPLFFLPSVSYSIFLLRPGSLPLDLLVPTIGGPSRRGHGRRGLPHELSSIDKYNLAG